MIIKGDHCCMSAECASEDALQKVQFTLYQRCGQVSAIFSGIGTGRDFYLNNVKRHIDKCHNSIFYKYFNVYTSYLQIRIKIIRLKIITLSLNYALKYAFQLRTAMYDTRQRSWSSHLAVTGALSAAHLRHPAQRFLYANSARKTRHAVLSRGLHIYIHARMYI